MLGMTGGFRDGMGQFPMYGSNSLQGTIASCVCDLDATIAASYGGSGQTWANLVSSPADGSGQTAYDFYLGADNTATTDDPTFTGSAGSASAYFLLDGGDFFTLASGTNTTFINNMTKTTGGNDWWVLATLRAIAGTTIQGIWSTQSSTTTVGHRGIIAADENLNYIQRQGSTNSTAVPSVVVTNGTDYLVIVSHSHSGNQTRWWINSTTATELSQTYTSGTADASGVLTIGAIAASVNRMNNTTRIYSFAMGNEYLDNTKAAAIIAAVETRHSRDYTP